eukprot:1450120-Pleurochrysis_carterae.AAC.1
MWSQGERRPAAHPAVKSASAAAHRSARRCSFSCECVRGLSSQVHSTYALRLLVRDAAAVGHLLRRQLPGRPELLQAAHWRSEEANAVLHKGQSGSLLSSTLPSVGESVARLWMPLQDIAISPWKTPSFWRQAFAKPASDDDDEMNRERRGLVRAGLASAVPPCQQRLLAPTRPTLAGA